MARILIVDDASIMRKNLKTILAEAGHDVIAEASNGSQAYIEYVKHKPDLVTMDITMPYMNGLDTLKKILNDYPEAQIIIISSTNNNKIILEAIQCGAKNYIIKPFMVDKVLDVVNDVLESDEPIDIATIEKIYKSIENIAFNHNNSIEEQIDYKSFVPVSISDNHRKLPTEAYNVSLKNNTFIITIKENIDKPTFNTLFTGMQGFLLVKPLKIAFDFSDITYLYNDYIKALVEFMNKAQRDGSVMIVTQNKSFMQIIKDNGLDPSISFYSSISILV